MNFIGGEDEDATILCVEERGNAVMRLVEFGEFCADVGRNDDESDDDDRFCVFKDAEVEDDDDSILLAVDLALGIDGKGWKQSDKNSITKTANLHKYIFWIILFLELLDKKKIELPSVL